jgi:hypothetical protein
VTTSQSRRVVIDDDGAEAYTSGKLIVGRLSASVIEDIRTIERRRAAWFEYLRGSGRPPHPTSDQLRRLVTPIRDEIISGRVLRARGPREHGQILAPGSDGLRTRYEHGHGAWGKRRDGSMPPRGVDLDGLDDLYSEVILLEAEVGRAQTWPDMAGVIGGVEDLDRRTHKPLKPEAQFFFGYLRTRDWRAPMEEVLAAGERRFSPEELRAELENLVAAGMLRAGVRAPGAQVILEYPRGIGVNGRALKAGIEAEGDISDDPHACDESETMLRTLNVRALYKDRMHGVRTKESLQLNRLGVGGDGENKVDYRTAQGFTDDLQVREWKDKDDGFMRGHTERAMNERTRQAMEWAPSADEFEARFATIAQSASLTRESIAHAFPRGKVKLTREQTEIRNLVARLYAPFGPRPGDRLVLAAWIGCDEKTLRRLFGANS